jgi:molybdenum cofactor cytidylyltransferase
MRFRPAIIVLAAGRSIRFGGPLNKLAEPFEGGTVLGSTLRRAVSTQLPVVVVTTSALAGLVAQHMARRDIVILDEAEAALGMGAAIAAGVSERSGAPGWLVLPGDMPLVRPDTMRAVAAALEFHGVVHAQCRGRRGSPVAYAAELFSELIQLRSDDDARRMMARYPAQALELDDGGVLLDVDTPAELEALREVLRQLDGSV